MLPLVVSVVKVIAYSYAYVCEDACQLSYCFALTDDDVHRHDTAPIAAAAAVAAASCAAASRARTSPAASAAVRCWADLVPYGSNSRTCLRVHKQTVTFVAPSMMRMRMQRQRMGWLVHCRRHYSQHCGACKCCEWV